MREEMDTVKKEKAELEQALTEEKEWKKKCEEGKDNNLLELIAADPEFNLTLEQLQATMEPSKYVGRAPVQVDAFLANVVNPVLEKNQDELGVKAEINV